MRVSLTLVLTVQTVAVEEHHHHGSYSTCIIMSNWFDPEWVSREFLTSERQRFPPSLFRSHRSHMGCGAHPCFSKLL